jgi:acetyl esterase
MAQLLEKTKQYLLNKNKTPSLASMSYREAREMRASLPKRSVELPLLASVENRQITMRDGATIPIRIYIPLGQGPFPIIIYYHGGGWVLNDLDTCHESCAHLSNKSQHIIVSIGYRLAPEYKFPIPVNDAFDSLLWAIENANELNGNAKQISLAGDSAGGNLAIAVCQLAKKEEISIISQILLYPVTDLSYDTASYLLFEKGFGLDRDVMKWFGDYYINDEQDAFNPLVAPLKMQDFSSLPPACIFVAENDVLRDEALQYAERLKAAEVKTEVTLMEGIVHSYFTNNDIFDEEIEHTIQTIHAFLTK